MSQRKEKYNRANSANVLNLGVRLTLVEADLLGLQEEHERMLRKMRDERLEKLRLSRAVNELRMEAAKREVSHQRIRLLCGSVTVIMVLILASCKLFGVI